MNRVQLKTSTSLIFLVLVTAIIACSVKHAGDFKSLINQGPLPLSSENPYLGSNLFLAHEAERSSFLFSFLKTQGGPSAIELLKTPNWDLEIRMYYGPDKEMFIARANERSKVPGHEWIIRGPYQIDRDRGHTLRNLRDLSSNEPVFEIWGKRYSFKQEAIPQQKEILQPVFVPTPKPTPVPTRKPVKKVALPTPTPGIANPSNFDQQALAARGELAERNSSGDVVHTVKSDKETLGDISRWYTGSAEAAPSIAEKNALSGDKPLTVGTKIVIPAKVVTNPKTMK